MTHLRPFWTKSRSVLIVAGVGLLARLVWAVTVPLLDGETYYWVWSKHLALSYLDHPPFVAYMIRLTTLAGDHQVLLRLGPLIGGVVTTLALCTLGREMFGARAGLIAAATYQVVPLLAGAGLFATPEAPLFLWWSLALLWVRRALWEGDRWWVPAGVAMGLGMLSKMTMIALPIGVLGFVLTRRRDVLRRAWCYLGAAVAVVLFLPVPIWNVMNGWANFRYALHERSQQVATGLAGLWTITFEQLAFTGVMFLVLLWMLGPAVRRRRDERFAFLLWMTVPTLLLVATVVFFRGGAHGYWIGPAYLGLAVVMGALWPGRVAATAMSLNAALMAYATLTPLIPSLPAPAPVVESVAGWTEVAQRVDELARDLRPPVVLAIPLAHFEGAAQVTYYTRRRYPVTLMPEPLKGSVWPAPAQFADATFIWIIASGWTIPPPETYFRTPTNRGSVPIVVRGREIRRFHFWTAPGLRGSGGN
ncbi:MAG: glycosyltransferase family 39 protein [Armatimonadota bacterium]|nr:glycosyltransferase family 39 protein [Armatimonadota bacterium]